MPRASAAEVAAVPAAATLGAFAAGVEAASLPAAVLDAARAVLACDLACALAAGDDPEAARALARGRHPAEATLLGEGGRAPAEQAAFANAVAIHARAQDDTHYASQAHAGAAVIPAALALAEAAGADGATLVAAVVAGYEVTAAVGEPLCAEVVRRGFRASGVFGAPGAAAAAARALGLDAERSAHAIALAASFAAGLGQTWLDGTSDYLYHLAAAARGGVTAALLAARGATGAARALEGEAGLARAFAGQSLPPASTLALGERFRIAEAVYKPYPVCNITQSPAALAARAVAEGIRAEQVTSVRLHLNPDDRAYPGTLGAGPFDSRPQALMSAAFGVAAGLVHGTVTLAVLDAPGDPQIAALAARTVVLADPALPPLAARLEVDAGDRRFAAALVPDERTYRWSFAEVAGFCRDLAREMPAGAAVDDLLAACARVEDLPDLGPLLRACVPPEKGAQRDAER
jgi:2-methylcitrate dehydratase PrpD